MSNVAVVTDTISCIPETLLKEYDIQLVPVGLVIDRKIYLDTELSNERFWNLFYKAKEPVTTNAITPGDFQRVFSNISQKTDSIICILVSKALSVTHQSAILAADLFKQEKPNIKIEVVDSASASGAEGFIVMEAAKAAKAGKSLEKVVQAATDTIPKVNFFCALDTLKYIIRSGRAPKIAFIGDIMKVKPIVSINKANGLVENFGRARGMDKAMEKMAQMITESIDTDKPVHVMLHYSDNAAAIEPLKKIVTSQLNCEEIYITPYTPVMASQCGPVIAVSYYQTS